MLGLNCGGSDGYSGITANPALGLASDQLVARGGTSVLAETPGGLRRRAPAHPPRGLPAVGRRCWTGIEWWKDYVAAGGGTMDNNPSPGNKAGGLTTILEKSLGAVAKGGTAELAAVYEYAEPVTAAAGFAFMDTPGYDPVSVTGLVAGGATVVVLHHRARLRPGLQAGAVDQGRDEHASYSSACARTWTSTPGGIVSGGHAWEVDHRSVGTVR